MVKSVLKALLCTLVWQFGYTQVSPDCATVVPICNNTPINGGTNGFGVDDFYGAASSGCLEQTTSGTIESNSAWYRFRTGASGQLGFNIGHNSSEDWDFALYQASDCNTLGEPIRCNFFDNSDSKRFIGVGEDPTGDGESVHYEDWLQVEPGQDYYLFINNFSNVNSGFSIQFTGDIWLTNPNDALDCSIINNLLGPPIAACEGDTVVLDATTSGAVGYEWYSDTGSGFQLISGANASTYTAPDSAQYRVVVATGTGTIISDVQVGFNASPVTGTLADAVYCHTPNTTFDLSTKDIEALGNQNPNEFIVSYHSSQSDADTGISPLPKEYEKSPGQETIYVRTTSLANPNCYDASESFLLDAIEVPELTFSEQMVICEGTGAIFIGETMPNPNYTYQWSTGEQSPSIMVSEEGEYTVTVTHASSGSSCEATRTITVNISELPVITDVEIDDFKPRNTVRIITESNTELEYRLDDGDFQSSNTFEDVLPGSHEVTMRDIHGCGEVRENIVVVGYLASFSPNGDVLNERWQIEGLSELNSPVVTIFDRYGKMIKQMTELDAGWDGNLNGKPLPSTDYWFKLSYVDANGNRVNAKYLQSHFSLKR
ncbi:T9SS type B sorting domain-containing protein [Flagellimonas alvinocaridis]|uniref:T9SS type B sorting domain-containing protein n=1 Tax=Flagellimonas alvinocaridis TaxID=2530200 RepID=A0A4S8RNH2_9FLAO|nr:T9SS type B sorting domain-containing protein [Allomuricauda alvinocaridis]THV60143.1 T9SS type B sorting domain-containing protein [Allomuricauda alvinocaridis]